MNESSGRAFAETWGLKVKGTLYVFMEALGKELLDKFGKFKCYGIQGIIEKGTFKGV